MRQDHISAFQLGKLELVPGCNLEESLESHVMGVLNRIRNEASEARPCPPSAPGPKTSCLAGASAARVFPRTTAISGFDPGCDDTN